MRCFPSWQPAGEMVQISPAVPFGCRSSAIAALGSAARHGAAASGSARTSEGVQLAGAQPHALRASVCSGEPWRGGPLIGGPQTAMAPAREDRSFLPVWHFLCWSSSTRIDPVVNQLNPNLTQKETRHDPTFVTGSQEPARRRGPVKPNRSLVRRSQEKLKRPLPGE